jgi:hypothetical protein
MREFSTIDPGARSHRLGNPRQPLDIAPSDCLWIVEFANAGLASAPQLLAKGWVSGKLTHRVSGFIDVGLSPNLPGRAGIFVGADGGQPIADEERRLARRKIAGSRVVRDDDRLA